MRKAWLAMLGGVGVLALWWWVLLESRTGIELGLGSLTYPTRFTSSTYGMFLGVSVVAIPLWYRAVAAWREAWPKSQLARELDALPDGRWVLLTSFLAFAAAMLVRSWVLRGAPLTDDEGVYVYSGQLLAQGRLWVESLEPRLAFDHVFLINDGRTYSQYPLGWPALMVPGLLIGAPGLINPLLSALTIPAVYGLGDALGGRSTARLSTVLFIISPMIATTAATLLSHTSAMAAGTWMLWVLVKRVNDPSPRWDAAVGALAGVVFFIRPGVGMALGGTVCLQWVAMRARVDIAALARRAASFAGPALVLAALFFLVNQAQTGSPWKLAYTRSLEYAEENQWRFAAWNHRAQFMTVFPIGDRADLAMAMLFRFNADLFGFPLSVLPLLFLQWSSSLRPLVLTLAVFLGFHLFAADVGIDTFAPVHVFEAGSILVVLVAFGLTSLAARVPQVDVGAATIAAFIVGLSTLVPMRMLVVHRLAQDVLGPAEYLEEQHIENALIFPVGLPLQCSLYSTHFVFQAPPNPPNVDEAPVVWANHLTIERDRELAHTRFPSRAAYILTQTHDCGLRLVPLDSAEAGRLKASPAAEVSAPKN